MDIKSCLDLCWTHFPSTGFETVKILTNRNVCIRECYEEACTKVGWKASATFTLGICSAFFAYKAIHCLIISRNNIKYSASTANGFTSSARMTYARKGLEMMNIGFGYTALSASCIFCAVVANQQYNFDCRYQSCSDLYAKDCI